ncbi:MAG: aspartate ammonia-lyase [Thermoplasmata archaeon]|nr:aspartate ammonia-lyase [Thermoplasmata archaeon]TFG68769.1 MAG: aspartate ammonia-lyase [Methanomassiliicoccus sp.]
MNTRRERDSLGEREVPEDAYYGIQTLRAVENFPVSGILSRPEFINAYAMVKKAAALANMDVGWLEPYISEAIVAACDEILAGKMHDQFVVDVFQAGAGTSFNMNMNEVIANRALELMGRKKGEYSLVHPNDHVNMSQSTNDTYPTAMRLCILIIAQDMLDNLEKLRRSFVKKGMEFERVLKSGRTHLMDALPVTLGQEFMAYSVAINKARDQLKGRLKLLEEVPLGATAVGTGANTHPDYHRQVVKHLQDITALNLIESEDPREALQSRLGIASISGGMRDLALELIRISNDLRLMNSGPITGLAEIRLPATQPGSSIMPGKVNPVMAECMDMICFQIMGNDLAVAMAVQAGQFELNVMNPVMMHNLLESMVLLNNYIPVFIEKCISGIEADEVKCRSYLDKNPSLATFLAPHIGYMKAAEVAKEALVRDMTVHDVVIEKGIMTKEEIARIFDWEFLIGNRKSDKK